MEEKMDVLEKTQESEGIGEPAKKTREKAVKNAVEEKPQEPVLDLRQFAFSRGLTSVKRAGFEAWLLNNILGVRHTVTEFDALLKEFER